MLFIGLMSGTSLDGVDGVLVDPGASGTLLLAHAHQAFEPALRSELLDLNSASSNEMHRAALAANGVSRAYAAVVDTLMQQAGASAPEVCAIGAHGQTVRHRPGAIDGSGYTVQLLNGALLAELTGIDVVCDFRTRDLAAGGQGAPLVPAFHASTLAQDGVDVAVLNLGGIANLTLLGANGHVSGFDTGPANILMDHWCLLNTGDEFDRAGQWAAQGTVIEALLQSMRSEPFFSVTPPKSTGRDLFNPQWLQQHLTALGGCPPPQDVQATLLELTARTVADALSTALPRARTLVVCGGGAFNGRLLARLSALLAPVQIVDSGTAGMAPDHVEALAFAWLAQRFVDRLPGNLSAVTGARGPRILGALYPA